MAPRLTLPNKKLTTSLRANYSQPEIYDKIAVTALSANAVLSLLVYIRPTHESAQSFRPCVYGQFDMEPLVGNQGIIVNARHFYSRCCDIYSIFVEALS